MSNTGNVLFSMCIVSIVFIVSMVVGYKDKYRVCKLSYRIMASFYMFWCECYILSNGMRARSFCCRYCRGVYPVCALNWALRWAVLE